MNTLQPASVEREIARRDDGTFAFFADGVEIEWPLATTCSRFPVMPDFYGFEVVSTGGGCTAWGRDFTYKGLKVSMLITGGDGCGHEISDDDGSIVLGVYEDGCCLCTWVVSQGEGDYPRSGGDIQRSDIERCNEPEVAEVEPATAAERTLRAALSADWCAFIEAECNQEGPQGDLLAWPADSACGVEVQRITRLADFVRGEWLDTADDVREVALHQIRVVCWG